jgi:beta-lactamase regulating signal transducer with metallopeptidase domain
MGGFFHFLEVALIVAGSLIGLTMVLVVLIAYLPNNPLKDVVAALAKRLGTTAAVTALAAPIELIPGVDVFYDVAGALFLVWYWATLFKAVAEIVAHHRATVRVVDSADQSSLLAYKSENRR